MIRSIGLLCILIAIVFSFSCKQDKAPAVDANPVKVIILAGQSNMVGQGNLKQIPPVPKYSSIAYHDYGYKFDLKPSTTTFGPEVGIMEQLSNHYSNENFILIKYAIGGSSLTDWAPDYTLEKAQQTGNPRFGNMYRRLHMIIDSVTNGKQVEFAAMAWMQGERDSKIPEIGKVYQTNLSNFIAKIREDLNTPNLPFIIGKVNPPQDRYPAMMDVREAQTSLSTTNPNVYLIETDDIEKWTDDLHYSTDGSLELGNRFGRKIVELFKK